MADQKPRRRIVLCMGRYCNQGGQAESLEACLTEYLGERGPAWRMKGPVRWEIANCLSYCGAGPNLILYPEDEIHHHMDRDTLEALVRSWLEQTE